MWLTVVRQPDLANVHHKYLSTDLLEALLVTLLLVSMGGKKDLRVSLHLYAVFSLLGTLYPSSVLNI